jgi:hypothetical protein
MSDRSEDLPEAAVHRLESSAFSSGLSVPDFAACLELGLQPVALVQGFCVMQWAWYGTGTGFSRGFIPSAQLAQGDYQETYRCPHGFVSTEHRTWGQNFEQSWVESAWADGYGTAYHRLIEEAQAQRAHGIVGVVDRITHSSDSSTTEFHFLGTAVIVAGLDWPAGATPWTTTLAGQRLTKSIEAGYMPVSIVASMASVRVWAYCMTEYLMEGNASWSGPGVQTVDQITRAHMAVRQLARKGVRAQLGGDAMHAAQIDVATRELAQGDEVIDCTLRGNRVRRFKPFDDLDPPRPMVRLG